MSKRKYLLLIIIAFLVIFACVKDKDTTSSSVSKNSSDNQVTGFSLYVVSNGLNVRKNPDAGSDIVMVLQQNDKVITDKVSHNGWYKVTSGDNQIEGYVNASYLADKPLSEEEIAVQKAAAATNTATTPATRSKNPDTAGSATSAGDAAEVQRPTLTRVPKN